MIFQCGIINLIELKCEFQESNSIEMNQSISNF